MTARPAGWGLCGCERPDRRHEPGCLWQLDRRRRGRGRGHRRLADLEREVAVLRALVDITTARPGDCVVCLGQLDEKAITANDNRCSRCYALIGRRRRATFGGDQ